MAQNNNNEINKIEVIREINDRYIVIKYFDAEVIYDKETKFINATKLCQHISKVTGKEKLFYNWIALKQTRKFIKDLAIQNKEKDNNFVVPGIPGTTKKDKKNGDGIPSAPLNDKFNVPGIPGTTKEENNEELLKSNNLGYIIKDGHKKQMEIRGTYLHLDLIPQLCNWASKEYAFKISYIINYINGIKDYDSAYSKVKNDELKAKDDEIESKTEEIKKIEEEHQKQLRAKDEELKAKEKELKKAKKELKESEKKNEKKTTIIKKKDEKVKELKEEIKGKTEELEDLRKTKSEDDIEIKKLKKDIEFLKSQLEIALKDNANLIDKVDYLVQETKEYKEELTNYIKQNNQLQNKVDIIMNELFKTKKEKDKAETETKEIKSELKGIPEIILIFISEEDEKRLYISRIKKDTESRVIKKLKDLKFKVFNKYQTYNSVIKYNEAIKEYKEDGFISTKRNYITLKNITLDEFIERIKETI